MKYLSGCNFSPMLNKVNHGTIPLASASSEVVIRLPGEKADAADVNQSFSSAHPSLAGLSCTSTLGNVLRMISLLCYM